MKAVSHYSIAFILFIAVFFSLVVMNIISFAMLRKVTAKEKEIASEHYYYAGFELSAL